MEALHSFIDTNMTLLYFAYGQVYFTAGLAIALQQRSLSNFALARRLWMLAAFGIVHGMAEWGNVFIPIQNAYLSQSRMNSLYNLQEIAFGVSFAFLLQFGISTLAPRLHWSNRAKKLLFLSMPVWSIAITITAALLPSRETGEILERYMLGFPAAMLTAAAFVAERRTFRHFPSRTARTVLALTAVAFALYGFFSGLIVPNHGIWLLSGLNYSTVFSLTGFPVQFYRALTGLAIAILIVWTLSIFDLELRQRLEATERSQALLLDRQRIARNLHDGVVQSIYAAGLQLEAVRESLNSKPEETVAIIGKVTRQLNNVMSDIRRYIFELGASGTRSDLVQYLKQLAGDFSTSCHIITHVLVEGSDPGIPQETKQEIMLIARECLGNVAKHSLASKVEIFLAYGAESLTFSVRDNGVGMGVQSIRSDRHARIAEGEGLHNMSERAREMGGTLSVKDWRNDKGTVVTLEIPLEPAAVQAGSLMASGS